MTRVPARPSLRPYLTADSESNRPGFFLVRDNLRLSKAVLRLSAFDIECVKLFDGSHSIPDILGRMEKRLGKGAIPSGRIEMLAEAMEQALFLDTDAWRAAAWSPVRPPSCIGCYEGDPKALTEQMRDQFLRDGGPGAPEREAADHRMDAILVPHIDYNRGGFNFAHGFKSLFEQSNARLFVIVGTSHYSPRLFTLTRKAFETPLGVVPTDESFIGRIEEHFGPGLFEDELLGHLPEHSIELEVVFLQHILGPSRPFRIVPIVVGSFEALLGGSGKSPLEASIGKMAAAIRSAEAAAGEPVFFIISGDLAHIGPKFGDPKPVAKAMLDSSREQDALLLERAASGDMAGYAAILAAEQDSRRICGFPPTHLTLSTLGPCSGRLLRYDQFVHSRGHESVSFASVSFIRDGANP